MSHLVVDGLHMRFRPPGGGTVEALRDINLSLERGELLSVLGPSGCGKTTLLNIVAGFLAPTEGRVTLDGREVHGPGPERGMVFQQGALFEWMSVRDNVGFGPRMKGMGRRERREVVEHLLETVGLGGSGTRRSTSCRGGCSSAWRWPAAWPTTRK
jgi:taurine transport system ATP-binding protein